jgi:hypothetical protein
MERSGRAVGAQQRQEQHAAGQIKAALMRAPAGASADGVAKPGEGA